MSETDTIKPGEPTEPNTIDVDAVMQRMADKQSEGEVEKATVIGSQEWPSHTLQAPNAEPRYKTIWQHLHKQRVVIQEKGGNIVIGLFVGKDEGYLKLENAEIHGRATIVKPGPVWIDRTAINHIHKQTDNIEKKGKGGQS